MRENTIIYLKYSSFLLYCFDVSSCGGWFNDFLDAFLGAPLGRGWEDTLMNVWIWVGKSLTFIQLPRNRWKYPCSSQPLWRLMGELKGPLWSDGYETLFTARVFSPLHIPPPKKFLNPGMLQQVRHQVWFRNLETRPGSLMYPVNKKNQETRSWVI